MKLSVAIICKNEEAVITKCLESVRDADEIVVCDTGSDDETVERVVEWGVTPNVGFKWNDDFSAARNYAADLCSGDWILSIDADEILSTPISEVKRQISASEASGANALIVNLVWNGQKSHSMVRVFKRGLRWEGAIHEHISCIPVVSRINIHFMRSPAHDLDPDRNQRILLASIKKHKNPRDMYYLGHDFFERGQWEAALIWYRKYIAKSTWRAEKADANLRAARCLFNLNRGDEARNACLQAILGLPEFREALNFMAEMSWEKEANTWRKYAAIANNTDVLFIREPILYSGSYPANRLPILEIINSVNPKTILDLGVGTGFYGELIRQALPNAKLTGIEIFEKYRNPKWDNYDEIIIGDFRDRTFAYYDLTLMIDVIEHLPKVQAHELLNDIHGPVLVSTPRNYDQGEVDGNIHQKHLSKWTEEDFPGWENYSNELSVIMLRR